MAWLRVALMVVSSMCVQSFWCQAARKAALRARICLARHGLGCFDEAIHRAPLWLEQAQVGKKKVTAVIEPEELQTYHLFKGRFTEARVARKPLQRQSTRI